MVSRGNSKQQHSSGGWKEEKNASQSVGLDCPTKTRLGKKSLPTGKYISGLKFAFDEPTQVKRLSAPLIQTAQRIFRSRKARRVCQQWTEDLQKQQSAWNTHVLQERLKSADRF